MGQTYNTTALILKRRDHQENDRLFCLYSREYGKIDVIAKGTKKIVSKLNSSMEPFYLVKLMIAKGKVCDKLANANLIESYQNLRTDKSLLGFALINYLGEVIDHLIQGQTMQEKKFDLILDFLQILNQEILVETDNKKEKILMLTNVFIVKFLSLLGYQPEIKRCLLCHRGIILLTKNIFDFTKGGIICEDCKKVCLIGDYLQVSDGVIKILQLVQDQNLDYFVTRQFSHDDLVGFNLVGYKLLLANIGRPLKSYEFLQKLP